MDYKKRLVDAEASPSIHASIHRSLISPTALVYCKPTSSKQNMEKILFLKILLMINPYILIYLQIFVKSELAPLEYSGGHRGNLRVKEKPEAENLMSDSH
jgi:hypothetical protein